MINVDDFIAKLRLSIGEGDPDKWAVESLYEDCGTNDFNEPLKELSVEGIEQIVSATANLLEFELEDQELQENKQ